jgi:biotin synthase
MPGDRASTPIRTTVTLSAPNRARRPAEPARPEIDSSTARARLRAAEAALLDERRLLSGAELTSLAELPDTWVTSLAALAHQVRLEWCGPEVEVEGILSAKTGGCPEDCHFCSQSSRFDTPVKATPFLDATEVLQAAEETKAAGASEFCIVLAVRGPDERTMQRLIELTPLVTERTGLNVAVSAGILSDE